MLKHPSVDLIAYCNYTTCMDIVIQTLLVSTATHADTEVKYQQTQRDIRPNRSDILYRLIDTGHDMMANDICYDIPCMHSFKATISYGKSAISHCMLLLSISWLMN